MRKTIPAISIIIPMYNAEKYIVECLDSILAQTFTDFEVIVVDDCSTDKSPAIVKSYLPKFNKSEKDKLKIIHSDKNFGSPAEPRNIGIRFAQGEYVMFVDSDDGITDTALEELYPIAKKFDADVVYCEKYYPIGIDEKFTTNKNLLKESVIGNIKYDLVSEPTLVSNDIAERLKDFLAIKFCIVPWAYLVRKDLISMYDLRFPNLKYGEDNFWDLYIVCLAKNLVRIPNTVYIYRNLSDSQSKVRSVEINIHRYGDYVFQGVSIISKFAEEFPFLKENLEFQYKLFNFLAHNEFIDVAPLYALIPAWQLDPLVRRELDKTEDKTSLAAFLFSQTILLNLKVNKQSELIQQMNDNIQKQNQVIRQQNEFIQNQATDIRKLQSQLQNN